MNLRGCGRIYGGSPRSQETLQNCGDKTKPPKTNKPTKEVNQPKPRRRPEKLNREVTVHY